MIRERWTSNRKGRVPHYQLRPVSEDLLGRTAPHVLRRELTPKQQARAVKAYRHGKPCLKIELILMAHADKNT